MKKAMTVVFIIAWFLCGCSVESFFEGGAPLVIITALVAIACAFILGGDDEQRND